MSRESVSITEAARLLDVSRQTIWRLIRDGKLPAFLVRRCRRIAVVDLKAYRRAHHVSPRFPT